MKYLVVVANYDNEYETKCYYKTSEIETINFNDGMTEIIFKDSSKEPERLLTRIYNKMWYQDSLY